MLPPPLRRLSLVLCLLPSACERSPAPRGDATSIAVTPPSPSTPASAVAPAPPVVSGVAAPAPVVNTRRTDTFSTPKGDLFVTPLNHATVLLEWDGKAIYVDPFKDASFDGLPKADVILVTDLHPDHLDPEAIAKVRGPSTKLVGPVAIADKAKPDVVIANGETKTVAGVSVRAVPMYNLVRGPEAGKKFHDKGRGNGYVLGFEGFNVYLSGDTECTPEMKALTGIDVAFVCMNLPYTMTPAEAATCVKAFKPKVLFPYHYRGQNPADVQKALAGEKGIEVRLRRWYSEEPETTGTPARKAAAAGEMCGGIAGIPCADGLACKMTGKPHPDQSGTCAKR